MEYIEVSAKTLDDAITKALLELETTSDNMEYEIIEKGSSGILGLFGGKPVVIKAKKKEVKVAESIITPEEFLEQIFQSMGMEVKIESTTDEEDNSLNINLVGEDMGILIGKRGQTLDSLQYLVSLVANKDRDNYIRVKLDTENYRQRRKETLELLARNIAYKVKRTKRPVSLEPMNPFERRVIHAALQNDKYVITRSEGEDPYRHVVISLKKDRYHKNNHSS